MDNSQAFLAQRERWPSDKDGKTFLGRAVHLLGQAMFPGAWDGSEPATPPRYNLAKLDADAFFGVSDHVAYRDADHHQMRQVRRLLGLPDGGPPERVRPSFEGWMKGLRLAAHADADTEPARDRYWHVQSSAIEALQLGVVHAVLWNNGKAQWEGVPPRYWLVDGVNERLDYCRMSLQEPARHSPKGEGFHPIYVQNEGLRELCNAFAGVGRADLGLPETQVASTPTAPDETGIEKMSPAPLRTGMAGRPAKSADILQRELRNRAAAGAMEGSLSKEVAALRDWLKDAHPGHPVPAQGTAENNLRPLYRSLQTP